MRWLLSNLSDEEIKEILDYELPSEELEYWLVYTIRSQKLRPDNKEKNEPFEWENLPNWVLTN